MKDGSPASGLHGTASRASQAEEHLAPAGLDGRSPFRFAPERQAPRPARRSPVGEIPVEWKQHLRARLPVPSSLPAIEKDSRILTMGSCFANEIRSALIDEGVEALPQLDSKVSEKLLWYTPTSLLQEARLAFGILRRDERDIWEHLIVPSRPRGSKRWQDPYRRLVFADTREELMRLIEEQDRTIREGFERADGFIFTLGLIEAWRLPTGNWACLESFPLDSTKAELHVLGFDECAAAIREIVEILHERRPGASVTLTVSPVPLRRTYREGIDVAVANSESKSTLRAAVGEVCRQHPEVHYFPSYEIVTSLGRGGFQEDGRHVRPEVVASALDWFLRGNRRSLFLYSRRYAAVVLLAIALWQVEIWASRRTFVTAEAASSASIGLLWIAYLLVAWEAAHWVVMRRSSVAHILFR